MTSDVSAVDQLFRILRHPHRRRALTVLDAADAQMTVRDLTTEIVTREHAARLSEVPSDAVKTVYLSLVHVHVPLLEDAELIEYDPNREVIEGTDLSDVEPVLSAVRNDRSSFELAR